MTALSLIAVVAIGIGAAAPLAAQAAPSGRTAPADSVVRPGMNETQVTAAWGTPSGSRARGDYKYLFFANGCQPACGIQDVVILERGQVVDAIARAPGHRYDGVSSSPAGRRPMRTSAPVPAPPRSPPTGRPSP